MKRYLTYIILAALTLLAFGCKKETDADRKDLDSRERVPISVTYSDAGSPLTSLSFTHGAIQKDIDVELNSETLHWSIESDKPWCKILPGEHIGPGSFTIEVEANESFEAREEATLTFVAGEYRGSTLKVRQNGSAFIISHPYLIFPRLENPFEVNVTTLIDQEWNFEHDEWLTVEPMTSSTEGDKKITTLKIWGSDNNDDSRYGRVILSAGEERDMISIYQFGQDYMYDGEGHIFFPNDEPASISFIAPTYMIKEIDAPAFASSSSKENGDGTDTFTIEFEDNLSDCEMLREIPVSIVLNNAALSSINLPAMIQDFLPAGGLMTAAGLKAFAAKIAAGESTESWETDGEVKVLQDIDMDGVTDWAGIGTDDHPFGGVFDGNSHSIVNLSTDKPLFNICNGATVKNIGLDKHCSIYVSTGSGIGGIANKSIASTFDHCTFAGAIEYSGTATESVVGAIVAEVDATSIINACKMTGSVKVSSGTVTGNVRIGGIAGNSEGTVSNCETIGSINITSGHTNAYIGGTTAVLNEGSSVSGNSFTGKIDLKGTNTSINAGSLYGYAPEGSWTFDFATDKSSPVGSINLLSYAGNNSTRIFLGGVVGLIGEGVSLTVKGFEVQTNFLIDYTAGLAGNYICAGGALGGCEPDELAGDLVFDSVTNYGTMTFKDAAKAVPVTRNCIGGIAGLVNGKASFSNCVNKAVLGIKGGDADNPANSNNYTMLLGGIAGHCYGADMSFTNCENQADLTNNFYSNRPAEHTNGNYYDSIVTGGIVGAFNFKPNPQDKTLTVSNCKGSGKLVALRGYLGGIVGYAYQATITNCQWNGSSVAVTISGGYKNDNLASYKGGMAGGLGKATVTGCTAKGNIEGFRYGSAASAEPGGIVGHVMYKSDTSSPFNSPVIVEECSYFGNLYWEAKAEPVLGYPGGIIALGGANSVVRNCRFGGKVMTTEINANNINDFVVGNYSDCQCTVEGISLWNGI